MTIPVKDSPGSIEGRVLTPCGSSNAAGILVFIPGRSFVAITGASGNFELSGVPPDTYTLHVESIGLARAIDLPNVVVNSGSVTNVGDLVIDNLQGDANNCGSCGNVCPANGGTPVCVAGACGVTPTTCSSDANCSSTQYCNAGACTPKQPNGGACSAGNQCTSGNCVSGTCQPIGTSCTTDANCSPTQYCSGSLCVAKQANGLPCSGNNQCLSNICTGGLCQATSPTCSSDANCSQDSYCNGGACTPKQGAGGACLFNNQCLSGNCALGLCQ